MTKKFIFICFIWASISGAYNYDLGESYIVEQKIIDAKVSQVWQVLMNFENYVYWNEWIPMLEGRPAENEILNARVGVYGYFLDTKHQITKLIKNKEFCWKDTSWFAGFTGGTRCRMIYPLENGKTQLVNTFSFTGFVPCVGQIFFKQAVRDGMRLENNNLSRWFNNK